MLTTIGISGAEPLVLKEPSFEEEMSSPDKESDLVVEKKKQKKEPKGNPNAFQGILVLGGKDNLWDSRRLKQVNGVFVYDVDLPGSFGEFCQAITPLYFDQEMNAETIKAIKNGIYRYFIDHERPFVTVSIPEQKISSKVLQVVIQESQMGSLRVEGNHWIKDKTILGYYKIKEGQPIRSSTLERSISFMNRNPFRTVDAVFSSGQNPNTTDLTLVVTDQKPYRFYLGIDNSGVPTMGRTRYFAGFNLDQMFGLDQIFFYQYTTSQSFHSFQAHTLQYTAYLYREAILSFYGGYSTVHTKLGFPSKKNSGKSAQGSIRYNGSMPPSGYFSSDFIWGFDYKFTNNNAEFVDTFPVFTNSVNVFQGVLGFDCKYNSPNNNIALKAEALFSPGGFLPNSSNTNYNSLRPDAKNKWIYLRALCKMLFSLPKSYSLNAVIEGQATPNVLIPSEQLGIGGASTVRGYDERQINGDSGAIASLQLNLPSFGIFSHKKPSLKDSFYFLCFIDGGYIHDRKFVPFQKVNNYLLSTGLGARYQLLTYLTGKLDWGIKLHHQKTFTGGWSMFQFSVISSF